MRSAIVSYKQLGDIVLLEPLARLLAERAGDDTHLFAKRAFAPIIDLMPRATPGAWSLKKYHELWATHAGSKATRTAVLLRARARTAIFPPEASAVNPGHRFAYDEVITTDIGDEYWARYFWNGAGGAPDAFAPPELASPPSAWKSGIADPPEGYLLCHPTAAWESKFWVPEGWAGVIDHLQEETGAAVVLTSGSAPVERRHAAAILSACRTAPRDLTGSLTIEQYAWITANARLLIAIDGSACHLADAFRIPAVKLYGQTPPQRWHYDRPGARVVTSSPDPLHLRPPATEIATEDVLQAATTLLG